MRLSTTFLPLAKDCAMRLAVVFSLLLLTVPLSVMLSAVTDVWIVSLASEGSFFRAVSIWPCRAWSEPVPASAPVVPVAWPLVLPVWPGVALGMPLDGVELVEG